MINNSPTSKSDQPPYKRVWFWVTIIVAFVFFIIGIIMTAGAAVSSIDIDGSISGSISGSNGDSGFKIEGNSDGISFSYDDGDDDEDNIPVYRIGETAKVGDLEITVNSIERNFSTGNRYDTPDDGYEYVKVSLTIANNSDEKAEYSPLDFEMEDGDGDIHSYATSLQSDHLKSGSLAPGGKKSGSLVFEVPIGDKELTLHYEDYYYGAASFNLN